MRQLTYHHPFKQWLVSGRHQAIIRTNAGILLIWPLAANFSEILIEIQFFHEENAFENFACEMSDTLTHPQSHNLHLRGSVLVLSHFGRTDPNASSSGVRCVLGSAQK